LTAAERHVVDSRTAPGPSEPRRTAAALPRASKKKIGRVESRLYYRRAFKPLADQRKWNVPNGPNNPHGTRGDGTDYDENFVAADRRTFLTCRGKTSRVKVTSEPGAGSLTIMLLLKLPKGAALDPLRDGAHVAL